MSPILNLVGMVDTGRISVIRVTHLKPKTLFALHYISHFFISDPDAFTISEYRKDDTDPLTFDEAKASIALAAVSGGMFEIGDNLQLLKSQPERLTLLENPELLKIVRDGRAAIPLDLMTYLPEDEQPSIFYLRQNPNRAVLTVFNWTDSTREHTLDLNQFGLSSKVKIKDLFDNKPVNTLKNGRLTLQQPRHSVRMLIIDVSFYG